LGGSRHELALAISADSAGNAYVCGFTASSDFPTTNAVQAELASCSPTNFSCSDAFVVKLNAAGAIVYSTYLGGVERDEVSGIAADAAGNAYVAGTTDSRDFPITRTVESTGNPVHCADALRFQGCSDAFVVKLNPAGELVYSTYVGGGRKDRASAIAVDTDGNAYTTGATATEGPGFAGAFVAKLNAGGSHVFSTFFGPEIPEERETEGNAIALDATGRLYVTGTINGGVVSATFIVAFHASGMPLEPAIAPIIPGRVAPVAH